ncbi:hypothetical protein B0H19DRAFT_1146763 [Mycena capillaripes]|nr:hypothetical protein B0H19DRAFT_1146763 [Mycena capillaripes]
MLSLAADRAHIARLDVQIQDLERSLAALRLERLIFMHFLPAYPLCPPLTGLMSPTLLTRISIELSKSGTYRCALVSDMLSRSSSCPLSIYIDEREFGDHSNQPDPKYLPTVLLHCERWEYATLHLLASPRPFPGPMPLLRQLDLGLYGDIRDNNPVIEFPELPLLCTAILSRLAAMTTNLPWGQLTSLTLGNVYLHECVKFLQQTRNLVQFEVQLIPHRENESDPIDTVTVSRLESLTLRHPPTVLHPVSRQWNYLKFFITPALRRLKLSEGFLGTTPIDALAAFISTSGSELQDVCVTEKKYQRRKVPTPSYRAAFPTLPIFSFERVFDSDGDWSESEQ